MTFEIELGGVARTVALERAADPGRFRVTVDGRALQVDAVRVGDYGLSLLLPAEGEARTSVELEVAPGAAAGEMLVTMAGRLAVVAFNGRRRAHGGDAGGHGHGEISITAPMPGRVLRVLVGAGDEVAARQPVVVVEAMKMENELRAPRAGRVKDVMVAPGTSVEAGRVLAVIE